ncbi:hypothetical protein D3228_06305 [Leucobacter luti]|nr:hypothetical protein [Leucobacter luti]
MGYDESDPAVIAARAGVAAEHQEAGEPHDCTGVAMIGELESLKQLLDAQRQRGDFWERRYKETAQVDEAKLAEVLVRGLTYSTGLDAETNNAIAAVQANDAAEWLRGGGQ